MWVLGHGSNVYDCVVGLYRRVANHTCCLGNALQWYLCTHTQTDRQTDFVGTRNATQRKARQGKAPEVALPAGHWNGVTCQREADLQIWPTCVAMQRRWASRRDHANTHTKFGAVFIPSSNYAWVTGRHHAVSQLFKHRWVPLCALSPPRQMSIWYERHKLHAGSAIVLTFNSLFQTHYERETLFEDRLKSDDKSCDKTVLRNEAQDFVIAVHRLAAVGI
jgi:hypothetical protein